MAETGEYTTLRKEGKGELVDRKSEFLAFATPVCTPEEALAYVEEKRKLHHDAKHCVYAYVLRDGQKRYSDDGEPQGTAGRPILDMIEKNGITDAVICVIRYFGGILLGPGGLVRAYTGAATLAKDDAGLYVMKKRIFIGFRLSYNDWARIERPLCESGARVEKTDYTSDVDVEISVPFGCGEKTIALIGNLSAGKCPAKIIGEKFS